MHIFSKKKPEKIDRRRSLAGIPVRNENTIFEKLENGNVVVIVKLQRGNGLLARFQPLEMKRRVKLDELGTFVFEQIDDKKDVKRIIDAFIRRYKTNRRESELSVVEFIKMLVTRHVISIVIR